MSRALPLLLMLPLFTGCTAVFTTFRLMEADRALAKATEVGARTAAPFEYTLAARHREEAWGASARSQYRVAADLSRTAVTWAEQARIVATGGTREIGQVGDDLTDERARDPFEDERQDIRRKSPKGAPDELDDEDFLDEEEEPRRPR